MAALRVLLVWLGRSRGVHSVVGSSAFEHKGGCLEPASVKEDSYKANGVGSRSNTFFFWLQSFSSLFPLISKAYIVT